MEDDEYSALMQTYIPMHARSVIAAYSSPGTLTDTQLIALAFDGINNIATPIHVEGLKEMVNRFSGGAMNGESPGAAIALVLLLKADNLISAEAFRQLKICDNGIFREALEKAAPSALIDMLDVEEENIPAEKLKNILSRVGMLALRGKFSVEQIEMAAKAVIPFLGSKKDCVLFEAVCALKELKSTYAYPRILSLLKDEEREIPTEIRRMLRAAAEDIAMKVTQETFEATRGFRGKGWNRHVFSRLARHHEVLAKLERHTEKAVFRK